MNPARSARPGRCAVPVLLAFALALALGPAVPGAARAAPARTGPGAANRVATLEGGTRKGALVVCHGGVGSGPDLQDGPQAAADSALSVLEDGAPALDAALGGTVKLENDPRFNAGTGANIRLDGRSIQMDASLMTGEGRFAAVGCIERVRNPVLVARAVMDSTPHLLLVGEGATRFAHQIGFADELPLSPEAEQKYAERMKRQAEVFARTDTTVYDWRRYWNFPNPMPADVLGWRKHGDTVGTVARDARGRFAATLSTGGTSVTLYGRVGDVPIYGCGLYAGPAGAVACTGEGEEIIRRFMARSVYEKLEKGTPARRAVEEAVAAFPAAIDLGLIAVDREGWGVAANRPMAWGMAGR